MVSPAVPVFDFCRVPHVPLGLRVRSGGGAVVVGGHPGCIPGFSMGIRMLGYNGCFSLLLGTSPTAVTLKWWSLILLHFSRWFFSGIIGVSLICVAGGGQLTQVTQRCWPRAELGRPGLPHKPLSDAAVLAKRAIRCGILCQSNVTQYYCDTAVMSCSFTLICTVQHRRNELYVAVVFLLRRT